MICTGLFIHFTCNKYLYGSIIFAFFMLIFHKNMINFLFYDK